jgi:hypothetical protein
MRAKAVRLQAAVRRSPKRAWLIVRPHRAKLLNEIVPLLARWERFYIRADSAGEIGQAFFQCRVVIELVALHGFTPEP